ncbi:MAG: hypothetical protein RI897_3657 [Verrucomicrobiota bacterium]
MGAWQAGEDRVEGSRFEEDLDNFRVEEVA